MAGKSVTYYSKARIRNEQQRQIGQQPNNGISSDDQRAVILSWILLARICSPLTVLFYFFSIPQHNKVKQAGSGKQRFIDSSFKAEMSAAPFALS